MEVKRLTGNAALDERVQAFFMPKKVREVRIHLSAAPTASDTFTIAVDSGMGSEYDTVLVSQDLVGMTDWVWRPNPPAPLDKNDYLHLTFSNADGNTYGIEVWFEE